jgi:hypothetical protein
VEPEGTLSYHKASCWIVPWIRQILSRLPPSYCNIHLNIILQYLRRSFNMFSLCRMGWFQYARFRISLRFILISSFQIHILFQIWVFLPAYDESSPPLPNVYKIHFNIIHRVHMGLPKYFPFRIKWLQFTSYLYKINFNIIFPHTRRSSKTFSPFSNRWFHSTPILHISIRSIWILSFHVHLGFQKCFCFRIGWFQTTPLLFKLE